jgi:hypothetical protein
MWKPKDEAMFTDTVEKSSKVYEVSLVSPVKPPEKEENKENKEPEDDLNEEGGKQYFSFSSRKQDQETENSKTTYEDPSSSMITPQDSMIDSKTHIDISPIAKLERSHTPTA